MSEICEHGSLKDKCEICERDEEIKRLEGELRKQYVDKSRYICALADRDRLRSALEEIGKIEDDENLDAGDACTRIRRVVDRAVAEFRGSENRGRRRTLS